MGNGPSATETRHLRTLFSLGAAGCLTDGQLLERFATLGGDPAELAFAALVERHGPMVLRVARSALMDEHSAHDAFQATFLILARKGRSLWVRDSLGPWLHAVAYRVATQSRSLEARRRLVEKDAARPEAHQPRESDRSDLARAIHQEIERLPQPYRLAVITCHLEGLTQHEAAAHLGWPVGTLQSRLARGRQTLRDRLRRQGLAPSLAAIAGKLAPVPPALTTSTAKAAATLHLGGTAAGVIAPAVLAMIETTTKGMLMTKLKLGALALMMACGLVGSGVGLGIGRNVKATDDVKSAKTEAGRVEQPLSSEPALDEPITPPVDGPSIPVLLNFHAYNKGEPGLSMKRVIDSLLAEGYPVKSIDVDKSPALRDRYKVTVLPTFLVVDGSGKVLAGAEGITPASLLAALYNRAAAGQAASASEKAPLLAKPPAPPRPPVLEEVPSEPPLDVSPAPRPWETVVRVKVIVSDNEWGYGSGAVIRSTMDETLILTVAHTFLMKGSPQDPPARFALPIRVDLFDGKLSGQQPAKVGRAESDLPAELVDRDEAHDLALIRIRPGRIVPAARIVKRDRLPVAGLRLFALGCSQGNDATAWTTHVLDPSATLGRSGTRESFTAIKCVFPPAEGRSGGGLYTSDGDLMGICLFADPNEKVGYYAPPAALRVLIDRNGLGYIHDSDPFFFPPTQERAAGPGPIPKSNWVLRDSIAPKKASDRPTDGISPTRAGSAQDRRLDDLGKKLDQVLKALEGLKGSGSFGQLKPDAGTGGLLRQ